MFDIDTRKFVLIVPFLLLGLTVHEFAHAWMAHRLGDDTAAKAGRLSFNPFRHLDPFGTLVLLLTSFIGWAKPVPVDPRNFREPLRDMSLVALAGPMANLILTVALALGFRFGVIASALEVFPESIYTPLIEMCFYGVLINLGLTIFNLLPLPPLDGFSVLAFFLPENLTAKIQNYRFFFFVALIILLATGLMGRIIGPIYQFCFNFLGVQ
jgi:Zn-dependent protease